MPGVDVSAMANLMNVSSRRVQQLARMNGFPPRLARGQYDAGRVMLWYVRHLAAELERRGDGPSTADLQAAKRELLNEQRAKLQMSNAAARGELLRTDEVRVAWTTMLVNCQRRLRAIPATLGPQLTNKSDPAYIADRLKNEINRALDELIDFTPSN